MKKALILLTICITASISSADITSSLEQIQAEIKNTISDAQITMHGTCYKNFAKDIEKTEQTAKYLQRAELGVLPDGTSPEKVEQWYQLVKNPHSYDFEYTYYTDKQNSKKIITTPEVSAHPWLAMREYSILSFDKMQYFNAQHDLEKITLGDQPFTYYKYKHDLYIDPLIQVYPLLFINDLSDATIIELEDNKVFIESNESNGFIQSIQAIIDPTNNGVADKTLIQYALPNINESTVEGMINHNWFSLVYYTENQDIQQYGNIAFPKQITSFRAHQCQTNEHCNDNFLPVSQDLDVRTLASSSPFEHDFKWDVTVDEIAWNQGLTEDFFWMSAPEGYEFEDKRKEIMTQFQSKLSQGIRERPKNLQGEGPHEFPQVINE